MQNCPVRMSNYKEIDYQNWKRKDHFEFFSQYHQPTYNIAGMVDVSALYHFAKEHKLSFMLCYYYCAIQALNEIPEFRLRLKEAKVVEFETIHIGSTLLRNDETMAFSTLPFHKDFTTFCKNALQILDEVKNGSGLNAAASELDLAYFTTIPWISFTSITHAIRTQGGDSIPRLAFGKMIETTDGFKMPFSVDANHSLIDGLHIGKLFQQFELNAKKLG